MKQQKLLFFVIFIFLVQFIPISLFSQNRILKKRIAVFDFADKTNHRWYWWRDNQPLGRGMADMLVTALVKSGRYVVIERQELEKILKEQQLGQSGLVTQETAAKVGKLLGVELAVVGSVTEFGYTKESKGLSFKGIGGGLSTYKATVGIDVRLINTSTGEIVAAENVRKEHKARGISFHNNKLNFKNQKDFDESVVGKATRKAIEQIVQLINKQMEQIPWQGKVIMQKGDVVFINAGSKAGLKIGDRLVVYREGEKLIDPDTGLELGSAESKVGVIEIAEDIANGKASKAKIIEGTSFQKGDVVRLK